MRTPKKIVLVGLAIAACMAGQHSSLAAQGSQTTTIKLSSSVNPSTPADALTFTAALTFSPKGALSGTIEFSIDGTNALAPPVTVACIEVPPIVTGAGQCLTHGAKLRGIKLDKTGSRTITARYSGNEYYAGSTGTLTQVVQ